MRKHDIGHDNDIKVTIHERTDKLDFIKIKNLCFTKTIKRIRQSSEWKKIFPKNISDKGLFSKIYKEFLKLDNKKFKNCII